MNVSNIVVINVQAIIIKRLTSKDAGPEGFGIAG